MGFAPCEISSSRMRRLGRGQTVLVVSIVIFSDFQTRGSQYRIVGECPLVRCSGFLVIVSERLQFLFLVLVVAGYLVGVTPGSDFTALCSVDYLVFVCICTTSSNFARIRKLAQEELIQTNGKIASVQKTSQ